MKREWALAGTLILVVATASWISLGFLRSTPSSSGGNAAPGKLDSPEPGAGTRTGSDRPNPGEADGPALLPAAGTRSEDPLSQAASPPPEPGATVRVRGRLLGLDPEIPWRGSIETRLIRVPEEKESRVAVDERGRFELELAHRDLADFRSALRIQATSPGYGPCTRTLPGADLLGPDPEILLLVSPAERLQGRVVDVEGRPVAGAFVEVRRLHAGLPRGEPVTTSPTAEDGAFELGVSLAETAWIVAYEMDGSEELKVAGGESWPRLSRRTRPAVTAWTFVPGIHRSLPDLVLEPCATICGTLRRADGRLVPGAEIRAEAELDGRFLLGNSPVVAHEDGLIAHAEAVAAPQPDGSFVLTGLGPLAYWIRVHGDDRIRRDPSRGGQRVVAPGEVEIGLPEHELRLRLTDSTGTPLAAFGVRARSEIGKIDASFRGAAGSLLLAPGSWELAMSSAGFQPRSIHLVVDGDDEREVVLEGGRHHVFELTLHGEGPLPVVDVWLEAVESDASSTTASQQVPREGPERGLVRWNEVPSGRYALHFYDRSFGDPRAPALFFPPSLVDVSGSDTVRHRVDVVRGGRLIVEVSEAEGQPELNDLCVESGVEVLDADGRPVRVRFGPLGSREFNTDPLGQLPAGTSISQPLRPGAYTVVWRPDSTEPLRREVRVQADQNTRLQFSLPD